MRLYREKVEKPTLFQTKRAKKNYLKDKNNKSPNTKYVQFCFSLKYLLLLLLSTIFSPPLFASACNAFTFHFPSFLFLAVTNFHLHNCFISAIRRISLLYFSAWSLHRRIFFFYRHPVQGKKNELIFLRTF